MTARERKELRRAEEEKRNKKSKERETALADANAQNATEGGETAAIQKRQIWIPVTCAVLALVIIFTAVLLLVIKPGRRARRRRQKSNAHAYSHHLGGRMPDSRHELYVFG